MALTYGGKRKPGGMGPRTPLDPLEQQLTDRIAAVLRALRNSTDVDAYVRAIQSLDPDALERLLARVEMGALGARIEETLRSVVITGGSAEGQRIIRETPRVPSPFEALQYPGSVLPSGIIVPPGLAPPPDVEFQVATQRPDLFEYVDRRATEYARTRAANLVVQVDSANRLAIRRVIHESFTQPATADQTARKLRSMVGLHTRWARAVLNFDDANYRRFLKDGMTQEAARARADVLTKRYSDRLIRRRAEMIARTEIQQAQNWGRQAAWDGGSKAGYVDMASMKEWRTAPMGSQYGPPCPICTELRGTRVPYNGTFANGYEMPPAHPHCRCTAVLVPPSRGLTGQPSQDMGSWLMELDALDAESIANYTPPMRKHGDPSRPGYAQLHPTGRHSITSHKDRVANALRTGEAMGLGWPSPPEIKAEFDQAVEDADFDYDFAPAGARMFRASHEELHQAAREFAIDSGMPIDDAPHGGMSSADIYADAIVTRARMVRRQQDAYQYDEDNDVDDEASWTLMDVRASGTVLVAVHEDAALDIVGDGRIRTQFEVGDSNGALDPDQRAVQETAVFDHHPASPVRTVYGYVANESMGIDPRTAGPSQYGDVRLEMVPSVRSVTSMTAGDTLGHNSTPIPMDGDVPNGDRGVHAALGRVNIPGHSVDVGEELRYQGSEWAFEPGNYFEAQIHAVPTTAMIAKVHWPVRVYDDAGTVWGVRTLFEEAGIEFEEYDPDDYAY